MQPLQNNVLRSRYYYAARTNPGLFGIINQAPFIKILKRVRMRKYHLRNLHFGSVGIGSGRNIRTRRGGIARRHTSAVVELTAEK